MISSNIDRPSLTAWRSLRTLDPNRNIQNIKNRKLYYCSLIHKIIIIERIQMQTQRKEKKEKKKENSIFNL